jgi:hypothetical protein
MVLHRKIQSAIYLLLSMLPLASSAQDTVSIETFESYTAGAGLCTQAPAYWYTWNNGPGTAEDPEVSDSIVFEGNNSLMIKGTNNILLDLNGKTTGRYELSFHILVSNGKTGFYGLLQQFAGNESTWGVQCYFDANNQGSIKSGGNSVDFNYYHNQWIPVKNIIDLDNNHAEIYINNILKVEWQWSKGLSGTGGIQKLDALNFFAWNADQRLPLMFVDSITYKEIPAPGPPLNLISTVNSNDVNLSWEAPANGIPSGYKIYRDSTVIKSLEPNLNYVDLDVYPGKYNYSVKAVYLSGLSQPAGPVEAVIEGGTARKYVLLEIATGTWCTYCPGSAMGADDLLENGKNIAVIEYHDNDDYANTDASYRNSYYNILGFPTAQFDGTNSISGGNMTQSMYPQYLPVYTERNQKLALFDLEINVTNYVETELQVLITARKIYPYANNKLRLQLALTETNIPETWQTIMTEVNSVCRKMYPDYNGTMADFSNDSILNFNYVVSVDSSYEFNNCALIAFLQDNNTKEVLQVDNVNFKSLGIPDSQKISASVYPNPATGRLFIKSEIPIKSFRILDINGRTLLSGEGNITELDVSSLKPGLYLLSIITEKGLAVKKFSISKKAF